MKNLEISREEALQLIEDDKRIDKGVKLFELSAEQKKVEKKLKSVTKKVDAYGKKSTRERKVNNEKMQIIEILQKALADTGSEIVSTANAEREFEFKKNDVKYKIVLSVPRK